MTQEIYINGKLVDVDKQVKPIVPTKQHYDYLSLGSVRATIINRVSLPLTSKNIAIFELQSSFNSLSVNPYRNYAVTIVQDGEEVIGNGTAQAVSVGSRIEIDAQSGIKALFDFINNKTVYDLGINTYNGLWDDNRRDTLRTATTDLIAILTDCGQLVDKDTYLDNYSYGAANPPFFYIKDILSRIISPSGKSFRGAIFADADYVSLVMSLYNKYNDEWLRNYFKSSLVNVTTPNNIAALGGTVLGPFVPVETGFGYGKASATTNGYDVNFPAAGASPICKISFNLKGLAIQTGGVGTPADLQWVYTLNGGANVVVGTGLSADFTFVLTLKDTDSVQFFAVNAPIAATFKVLFAIVDCVPVNTTDTDLVMASTWWRFFDQCFPSIPQAEFLKEVMMFFGLVIREAKDGSIEFAKLEDLINGKVPLSFNYIVNGTGSAQLTKRAGFTKIGATTANDTQVYSVDGYVKAAYLRFKSDNVGGSEVRAGLTTNPVGNFVNHDYSFQIFYPNYQMIESGAAVGVAGTITETDLLEIIYDGVNIIYRKNQVAIRTVARAVGLPLYFASTYYQATTGTIDDVVFAGGLGGVIQTLPKKRIDVEKKKNFRLTGFSQTNYFRWTLGQDIVDSEFARGSLLIDDLTLKEEPLDKYTSGFYASDSNGVPHVTYVATIKTYDQFTSSFVNMASFGTRILLLKAETFPVRFKAGTSRTDYKKGYFHDGFTGAGLTWQYLLQRFYNRYGIIINRYVATETEHALSSIEFNKLNFFVPTLDEGAAFIIVKGTFNPNGYSKLSLIKI